MKRWLSQYQIGYPRALVYMLQASEYNVRDYLKWYKSVVDFRQVENRKQLVRTNKSTILLISAWALSIILIWWGLALATQGESGITQLIGAAMVIFSPHILAYALLLPLAVFTWTLQRPIERSKLLQAKQKLSKHSGYRIAIAGSFGKTSMREILKTVLAEGKKVAAPPHSHNTPLGISQFIDQLTGDEEVIIFELGEYYPGDVRQLCDLVQPHLGVITGVNEAHLEKFKTLEATTRTIFELSDYLNDQPTYVNGASALARQAARPEHLLYTESGCGEWQVESPMATIEGTDFVLVHNNNHLNIHTHLLGLHQLGPLAAAANIASRLGLSDSQIKAGLEKVMPFEHRMQPTTDSAGVTWIDDSYNGNPDGVTAILRFMKSLRGRRRIYVTPGLVEAGPKVAEVHRAIGKQLAEAGVEKVVLVRNSVTPHIEAGLKAANYSGEIIWFETGPQALAALPQMTVKGDIVLLQNDWPDQYR